VGWLLPAVALLSAAGQHAVKLERRGNTAWMLLGHRTLRDGDLGRIVRLHNRAMVMTFLRGVLGCMLGMLLLLRVWIPLLAELPPQLHRACAILVVLLPGLGVGTMIDRYGLVRSLPWVAGGLVVGAFLVGVLR
jgi:mannose/fructose/N-acetylgalactosamine-specific phosphotransferase system component IIC